jgi:opacity protein-like surface antigen
MRGVAILSAVALVGLGAANCAAADDGRGVWYVLPSYHQAGIEKANMKYRQGANQIKFNTTFGDDTGPGFAVGYAFDAVYRVDVEYQRQTNDLKVPGTNPFNGSSLKSTTVAVDGWRDFAPWHQLRAYVGVGVGGGKLELDSLDTNFYIGRLGGGVVWYFRPGLAVDIGYRYQFATSNPELSGNSQKVTTEFSGQSVQIGFRYDF